MRTLAISVVSLCLVAPLTAQNTAVAFDSTNHIVATLDLTRGTVESRIDAPITAVSHVVMSPDQRTVLAINNGGVRTTGMFSVELHPDKKGSWALLSGDKVIGKGDLGWGLAGSTFAADGKSAY